MTLTRIHNRGRAQLYGEYPELYPARDRRPIKNAALQNEVESALASLAHAAASSVITLRSCSCLSTLSLHYTSATLVGYCYADRQ